MKKIYLDNLIFYEPKRSKHSEEYYSLLQKIQSEMTAFLFRNYSAKLNFSTFISNLDNGFPFIKL